MSDPVRAVEVDAVRSGEPPHRSVMFDDYVRVADATARSPIILHAPHAGRVIPKRFRGAFSVSNAELDSERDAMTDHFTDRLVSIAAGLGAGGAERPSEKPSASAVINGVSRFVVDVERFDDDTEEMNAAGMGVLYTQGSQKQPIRELSDDDAVPLRAFYNAYADAVERLVDAAIAQHGRAVIIDVHSYPRQALPYELHADRARPELCVGFDAYHAGDDLLPAVESAFSDFEMIPNSPFDGAYVPRRHFRSDERVRSVMLEFRRDCYLEKDDVKLKQEEFDWIAASLRRLIDDLG